MSVYIKFPQVTTDEDWRGQFTITDDDTALPFDLTGKTIKIEVQDKSGCTKFAGSTSDGAVILSDPTDGIFTFVFRKTVLNALTPGLYNVGCVIIDGADTDNLFTGALPVIEGYVT